MNIKLNVIQPKYNSLSCSRSDMCWDVSHTYPPSILHVSVTQSTYVSSMCRCNIGMEHH